MSAAKRQGRGPLVIEVGGSASEDARRLHADALAAVRDGAPAVVVDLTALAAVDGGILGTLCLLQAGAAGRSVKVVASASVRDALVEWRFDTLLDLFADRASATAAS